MSKGKRLGKSREGPNKKQLVTRDKKSGGLFAALGAVVAALAVAALIMLFSGDGLKVVSAEAGVVNIPVNEISDGKAHFYAYAQGGKEIRFFVLKSSDGIIRAAFDACDVCFERRKGYRQEDDLMVCDNCGQRFPSVKINELKGGCNPAPLDREVVGGHVVLNAGDIELGGYYF
jgi:uncharacterized membrane protein